MYVKAPVPLQWPTRHAPRPMLTAGLWSSSVRYACYCYLMVPSSWVHSCRIRWNVTYRTNACRCPLLTLKPTLSLGPLTSAVYINFANDKMCVMYRTIAEWCNNAEVLELGRFTHEEQSHRGHSATAVSITPRNTASTVSMASITRIRSSRNAHQQMQ